LTALKQNIDLSPKRFDYQVNHQTIQTFIAEYVKIEGEFPTQLQIKEGCDLSKQTVTDHMKDFNIGNYMPMVKQLTPMIVMCVAKKALAGSYHHQRLYLEYVEKHSIRNIGNQDAGQNNFYFDFRNMDTTEKMQLLQLMQKAMIPQNGTDNDSNT